MSVGFLVNMGMLLIKWIPTGTGGGGSPNNWENTAVNWEAEAVNWEALT